MSRHALRNPGVRSSRDGGTVTISTPTNNTIINVNAKFDANGTYTTGHAFSYIYLEVYDTDLVTVLCAENADPDTTNHTWTQPDDVNGDSMLHAPSVGLGETKPFKMTAELYVLYQGQQVQDGNVTRNLQVSYPVP